MARLRDLWAQFTGQPVEEITDPREAVGQVFGFNRRGNPNADAAAAAFGVHPDTVRKWIREDPARRPHPKADNARKLQQTANAATEQRLADPAQRITAIPEDRAAKIRNTGMTIAISGTIGISDDYRPRNIDDLNLSPAVATHVLDAYTSTADEAALREALSDALASSYAALNVDELETLDITLR